MMKPSSLFTSPSSSRGVDIRGPWLRDRAFFQGPADLCDERAFMVDPTPPGNVAFKIGRCVPISIHHGSSTREGRWGPLTLQTIPSRPPGSPSPRGLDGDERDLVPTAQSKGRDALRCVPILIRCASPTRGRRRDPRLPQTNPTHPSGPPNPRGLDGDDRDVVPTDAFRCVPISTRRLNLSGTTSPIPPRTTSG